MHQSIVFCSACTMLSSRKSTFALSSPDEFLVINSDTVRLISNRCGSAAGSDVSIICYVLSMCYQ